MNQRNHFGFSWEYIKKSLMLLFFVTVIIVVISGCGGSKKAALKITSVLFSPDGSVCAKTTVGYSLCKIDTTGKLCACQPVELPEYSFAKFLAADIAHNRYYYAADDSIFMFDRTTGLNRTMTIGAFAQDAQCGRMSPNGKYLAFSASQWHVGDRTYWRLVVVDAVEGGIIHYCDSLLDDDSFEWISPERIGYAELWTTGMEVKLDTVGRFYDVGRRTVMPTRDGLREFLTIPCDPSISYDGVWTIEIIDSVAVPKKLK